MHLAHVNATLYLYIIQLFIYPYGGIITNGKKIEFCGVRLYTVIIWYRTTES